MAPKIVGDNVVDRSVATWLASMTVFEPSVPRRTDLMQGRLRLDVLQDIQQGTGTLISPF